jgi:type II secretory pathway component PulK
MIKLKTISSLKQLTSLSTVDPRASILIIALWSLCLLSAFAVILGYQVRQRLVLVNRLDERDRLRFLAEAGIRKGITELTKLEVKTYDALNDGWSNNSIFKEISLGEREVTVSYNDINKKSGLPEVHFGFMDEERKINLNKIDAKVMERLFKIVLNYEDIQAQELGACIVDWRDQDSELTLAFGSAEDSYYNNLLAPYAAKNSDIEVLDELPLIKGFDDKVLEKVKDYVTIYGDGRININTASEVVLLALGLDENVVNKIILYRLGDDGIEATADDNIFATNTEIFPKLSQAYQFSAPEIEQLLKVCEQYLTVRSANFMIKSTARSFGKNALSVNSVVNRKGKVLYWRED